MRKDTGVTYSPAESVLFSWIQREDRPPGKSPAGSRHRGQAEIIDEDQFDKVLLWVQERSRVAKADELKLLLSYRAGLRASEIAETTVRSLVAPDGIIRNLIEVGAHYSKNGKSRSIPMHPDIRQAVRRFRSVYPEMTHIAISKCKGGYSRQSANAVAHWFGRTYAAAGLVGCSSHSGRRSFLTALARRANLHGASLRDVQRLAGHARLDTTERYIEPAEDLTALVNSLGAENRIIL